MQSFGTVISRSITRPSSRTPAATISQSLLNSIHPQLKLTEPCFAKYRNPFTAAFKRGFHSSKYSLGINQMGSKFLRGEYPNVRRDLQCKDSLHGQEVCDPYRWLEDPDSAETKEFVEAQNKVTEEYLSKNKEKTAAMRETVKNLYNYPKLSPPFKRGKFYYQFYNPGLLPQSVLYQSETLDSELKEFFNPNNLSEDGTVSLSTYSFSDDGKYFAYGTSQSGSDWVSVRIKEVETGKLLDDKIDWIKFSSLSWTGDNKGLFYSRYPSLASEMGAKTGTETESVKGQQVFYHKLNTQQSEDVFVFEDKSNADHFVGASTSYDSQWIILTISGSCDPVNKVYLARLHDGKSTNFSLESFDFGNVNFVKVVDNFEAGYEYVTNEGSILYFHTNLKAPKYRLVKIDADNLSRGFEEVIPASSALLESVHCVSDKVLALVYLENVVNNIQLYTLDGTLIKKLPHELGSIQSLSGRRSQREIFFYLSGFLNPGIIYHCPLDCEPKDFECTVWKRTQFQDSTLAKYLDENFSSEQMWYSASDGTKIPMFFVQKKTGTSSPRPTLLYGYGGFNISITPAFSPFWISFMDTFGGILCIPNIRGGGEFGDEWHRQGILEKKQRGLDDFQEAAKFLIQKCYTTPSQITINGGSNGGLLVGASITQAPELFGCAIADVGVLDMLRFHKFTVGHAWKSDYGDPDDSQNFKYIIKYSPLHNVKDSCLYPPTLLATGSHDDRVSPLHTFKFLATLQHHQASNPAPLIGRIETKAGHGAGKPIQKKIDECVDKLSFISLALQTNSKL
ncbi:hypothetical protein DSO57_1019495 [Entomophthora muscae]|uniref:Uncharacterized protein n=1 Tax=Entomophthora muscae TaxID=34485 RepID=A0ACC2SSY2_9FUNG|nr:hypothetical protein DSO57_1019495 [Entomophthora muscae]